MSYWTNGGYVGGLLQVWRVDVGVNSLVLFRGMRMQFGEKIMSHCPQEVKCLQGCIPGTEYSV